jgi:hypothetical protein
MKETLSLLATLSLLLASCSRKEAESASQPSSEEMASQREVVSLDFLRANQKDYVDQEVTVATYLFTHEEGPWVAESLEKPLWNGMALKIGDTSRIIAKDSSRFRWWFEYQEGYPVILTGVFRVGRWKTTIRDHYKENHPFIEVSQAREVSYEDAAWKTRKAEGEQAGTGQPATRPESKPEGGNKPQPEAEGRSR